MAKAIEKAQSVGFTDGLQAGFHAAIERIESLNLNPLATLVDKFSKDAWLEWDASDENALVIDSDGLMEESHNGSYGSMAA